MSYGNKEYQVNAIEQLVKSVSELLAKDTNNKVCVFQSPTDSGKTVMVAKFIEEIIKELSETDLCFLWVSIGKGDLHKQSKNILKEGLKIYRQGLSITKVEDKSDYLGSTSVETRSPSHRFSVGG